MSAPRLLDLFCGAGGAGEGYRRAGFDVTGVDIKPMPRNPHTFIQADALEYVAAHGHEYDAIHASPPCQAWSRMRCLPWVRDKDYPELIEPTRDALECIGRPWVIENVEGAPLRNGVMLCGTMFGLRVYRHRRFESSILLLGPPHHKHRVAIGHGPLLSGRNQPNDGGWVSFPGRAVPPVQQRGRKAAFEAGGFITVTGDVGSYCGPAAMGIDWMTGKELSQAIPPAYTDYIGRQLMTYLSHSLTTTAAG